VAAGKLLVRRSVGSLRSSEMRSEYMAHFESTLTMVYVVRTAEQDLTTNRERLGTSKDVTKHMRLSKVQV